jgi:ubiquinone/menaquinone biosynthesis C-methylase UbiE
LGVQSRIKKGALDMTAADKVFTGSIPEFYERYMVPLIFQDYATDLAGLVAAVGPKAILETAAGTGVVTRALAARLPADVRIVASDLNQPMIDHAAKKQGPDPRITWRQADALALPFEDGSFDAVVCQFGAMFFPDRVKGYQEARRVLKPNGHFFFSAWDKIADNEFADVVTDTLAKIFPQDPPRFMARTPHGYHDVEKIRADLAAAGFTKISIQTVTHRSKAPSPRHPAIAYCQGTVLRTEIEARDPAGLEEATRLCAEAIAARFGNGPVDSRIQAHVITAAP